MRWFNFSALAVCFVLVSCGGGGGSGTANINTDTEGPLFDYKQIPDNKLRYCINAIASIKQLASAKDYTEIDCTDNLYSGKIKDLTGLSNFINLKTLNLSRVNSDTVAISIYDITEIEKLTLLEELYIDRQSIDDLSPLRNLSNLRILSLVRNNVTDTSSLSDLQNLTYLNLSNNAPSTGQNTLKMTYLAGLTKLETLILDENFITDASDIGNIINLKSLSIKYNYINDFTFLNMLTNLEILDISWQLVTPSSSGLPNEISSLTKLKSLYAEKMLRYGSSLDSIASNIELTTISLSHSSFNDLSPLTNLNKLVSLNLNKTTIKDFSDLSELSPVKYLYLKGIFINASSEAILFSEINALPNIEKLVLTEWSRAINITSLISNTSLKELSLESSVGINNLDNISSLSNLTNLSIIDPKNITYNISELSSLSELTELYIDFYIQGSLQPISNLTNLSSLVIISRNIDNSYDLMSLVNLTNLVTLRFGDIPNVSCNIWESFKNEILKINSDLFISGGLQCNKF